MKDFCLIFWIASCALTANGLETPLGGEVLNDGKRITAWLNEATGVAEPLADGGMRITVRQPDISKAYIATFTAELDGKLAEREPVLAVIKARTVGSLNQGSLIAKLQVNNKPFKQLAPTVEFSVPYEWTEIPVTFTPESAAQDKIVVQLQCGHKEQTLEVQAVRIQKYPAGTSIDNFPRIKRSYAGREENAPWRKLALERIEKYRKADLSLQLFGQNGKPLAHQEVKVELRKHQFGFGSAVTAQLLDGKGADSERYREIVDRYFSVAVFENDLKDGNWEPQFSGEQKRQRNELIARAFTWLESRNIRVRGHYLMQVATPYNLHGVKDSSQIRERVMASVNERLEFVKDKVYEWDVINHPIAWEGADMLTKRSGLERLDREVYRLARAKTPLPFFVNEDQIFRPGHQHDNTFTYIQALLKDGFDVAGLGNQAHFSDSYLPSPEHLLAVTDYFTKIVAKQSITEFDVLADNDEQLAADFTRDILIATFSHPSYTSFLFWGFWEGSHWIPQAASWNEDWSIKGRGRVIEEWIGNKWRTRQLLKTDVDGYIQWRGFPGWYEIAHEGNVKKANLTKESPQASAQF